MIERQIDGMTQLTGVVGWPLMHELSPAMYNAAFAAQGMNWRYVPMRVQPADLGDAVKGLRALGYVGVDVAAPHKEAVIAHLADVSDDARALGAVNTLVRRHLGGWRGENTDVTGFAADLFVHQVDVRGKLCMVLGAGGASRAAVWVLVNAGAQVAVFNRTESRALDLVRHFTEYFPGSVLTAHGLVSLPDFMRQDIRIPALIVNATPVGMWPHVGDSPWPGYAIIPPEVVVYDMVYKPSRTRFMQQALDAGARALTGLGMLVRRGSAAFKLWTGKPAPVQIMAQTVADTTASGMPGEGMKGI